MSSKRTRVRARDDEDKRPDLEGRVLVKRQQAIYRKYRVCKSDKNMRLSNIYKQRVFRYYDHGFYVGDMG